jgi:drug/metabolite transporter (DMT)-like permease
MIAFAANPLICRLALGQQLIDAASFTSVRIMSGAVALALIVLPRWRRRGRGPVDWWSVAALFIYMVFFAFAYRTVSASTGTLLLFAAVQFTMFVAAMRNGERFTTLSWIGFSLAVIGLIYLVSPGATSPDPLGAVLMVVAGAAWGGYSLLGRSAADPLESTAMNFICSVPLAIMVTLLFVDGLYVTPTGLILAAASGAIASGLGYAVWYAALKGLTASRADRTIVGSDNRSLRRYHLPRRTGHSPSHPRVSADTRRHSYCPGSAIDGGFPTRTLNPVAGTSSASGR